MKKRAVVFVPAVVMMLAVGQAMAVLSEPATPVSVSWDQYATHESLSVPHAYIQYRLVKFLPGPIFLTCAEQEVDTGIDGFDTTGSHDIAVPPPEDWDLNSVPCFGQMEEQTRLVWRIDGEPPIYGIVLPEQVDRGDGWIAQKTVEGLPEAPSNLFLASFTATRSGDAVLVEWETASETGTVGFNLYRGDTKLNQDLILSRAWDDSTGATYTFVDNSPGHTYWLEDVDVSGHGTKHGPAAIRHILYLPSVSNGWQE